MPAYAVLGAQWGDEGKGKIVDVLARDAHIVARFAGGNNAGHTVVNDQGKFSFHLIPCGVFWPDALNVIGNGVVVDPDVLLKEIDDLKSRGIDISHRIVVSERAHLIMPYHVVLDELAEKARGSARIGTTGKGIGPAYADKAARTGLRAADLLDIEALIPRLENILQYTNAVITKVHGGEPLSFDEVFDKCRDWSVRLAQYIGPAEKIINQALCCRGERAPGRRTGRTSRPGPWHLPVRYVIQPDHRRSIRRRRGESKAHSRHYRCLQSVHDSSRNRTAAY